MSAECYKNGGPTEIRTRIVGFKVQSDSHYTIRPTVCYFQITIYELKDYKKHEISNGVAKNILLRDLGAIHVQDLDSRLGPRLNRAKWTLYE